MAAVLGLASLAEPASALGQKDREHIAGAVIGLAIAGAIAEAKDKDQHRHDRRSDYYVARYHKGDPVYCYPRTRACYWRGRYASKASHREFGYR